MTTQFSTMLAIETATPACSVALLAGDQIYARSELGNNIHSQLLLPMVDDVLQQASLQASDLQLVVVGQGPGSFTGLRIGIGVAQGLAYGAACPMLGISSLDALAQQAIKECSKDGQIVAGIDARMGEIYWAEYQKNEKGLKRCGELRVNAPDAIASVDYQSLLLVGNAWAEYWNQLSADFRSTATHLDKIIYPNASALLGLAKLMFEVDGAKSELCSPIDFSPEYVRNNVAKKSVWPLLSR